MNNIYIWSVHIGSLGSLCIDLLCSWALCTLMSMHSPSNKFKHQFKQFQTRWYFVNVSSYVIWCVWDSFEWHFWFLTTDKTTKMIAKLSVTNSTVIHIYVSYNLHVVQGRLNKAIEKQLVKYYFSNGHVKFIIKWTFIRFHPSIWNCEQLVYH